MSSFSLTHTHTHVSNVIYEEAPVQSISLSIGLHVLIGFAGGQATKQVGSRLGLRLLVSRRRHALTVH